MEKKEKIILSLILGLSFFLNTLGLNWGLPSETLHLQTYHPDEVGVLVSLQRMNPKKLDFNPHFFPWGTFQFYLVGIFLGFMAILGRVKLVPQKEFYILHLREMDKLYMAGRMVSVFAQTGSVLLLYLLVKRLYSKKVAFFSALFFALMPLAVADAHYLKPNSAGLFFILATAYVASRLWENRTRKIYIFSGILSGLATATKYNGVWAILFPLLFHFFSPGEKISLKVKDKNLLFLFFFFFIGFFLGCPYSVLAFSEFKEGIFQQMTQFILVQHGDIGNPFLYHLFYSLRYGMGTPLFLLSLVGLLWVLVRRDRRDLLFSLWIFSYYLFISFFFKSKFARHMLPLLPFLALISSRFILEGEKRKPFSTLLYLGGVAILLFTFLYTLSYDFLYIRPDPRTRASHWIEKNIPPGSSIGVLWEPYFYTPPIVYMEYWVEGESPYNRGNPEKFNRYRILVKSKGEWKGKLPDYLVVSEYEIRDILKYPRLFPREFREWKQLNRNYRLLYSFSNTLNLGPLRFRKGFPPHDLLYPFPEIKVYKMIN